tara:strand:- start:1233 stop:3104 length:1872 start_codon:yes stop_codon:yes gene_type:complete
MKILITGDIQFGRNKMKACDEYIFKHLQPLMKNVDMMLFNLESVLLDNTFDIDKYQLKNKEIHIYSYGEKYIKNIHDIFPKPIFISLINNHTFDYNIEGYLNTIKIVDKYNNFKFTIGKSFYCDDNFVYINATDHWTVSQSNVDNYPENRKLWNDNCLLIDSPENEEYVYRLLEFVNEIKENRKIIFSIHWGKNFHYERCNETSYLQNKPDRFFKKLCDSGVDIVFGHGAHHILTKPYEMYNNKLIIYGLGDCTGDFNKTHKEHINPNKSITITYDINLNRIDNVHVLYGSYKPYLHLNTNKCKVPNILDDITTETKWIGGGRLYATEIEFPTFAPYLNKYGIKLDTINKELLFKDRRISYEYYFNDNFKYGDYCRNKELTYKLFEKHNIPYPMSINNITDNIIDVNHFPINFPVVLKPKTGAGGQGIITNIDNLNELKNILYTVDKSQYIIQEQSDGIVQRVLIFKGKIMYWSMIFKPFIVGDGIQSINSLIYNHNKKLNNENKPQVKIISERYIYKQGYKMSSVPENSKKIYITNVVNYFNGAVDSKLKPIEDIHPINIALLLKTSSLLTGLHFVGIDYIGKCLSIPYYNSGGKLLELNFNPGFKTVIDHYPDRFIQTLIS